MEAERAFIGCVLLNTGNDVLEQYYNMPEKFITDDGLQVIWSVIVGLRKRKQPIDLVTVCTKLKARGALDRIGGPEFIAELQNEVPLSTHINAYYTEIFEAYKIKRIKKARNSQEVIALLEKSKQFEISTTSSQGVFDKLATTVIADTMVVEDNPLTWTIDSIDKIMGRPVPGSFYVLAGETGVGKSILSTDMAIINSKHANVAFFSLEMEKSDFLQDYIHTKIGKIRDDIMSGDFSPEDKRKALQLEDKLNKSTVAFIDDTGMSDAGVQINVNEIIKLCDDNAVTMVFVDSLSKLRPPSDKSHVAEAVVTDILAKWRNRRMEEGNPITIFIIHHLDKSNTTVAGSAKIEQDATGLIKLRSLEKGEGTITWETGKLRKNRYCKRTLQQKDGGLVDAIFQ